LAGGELPQLLVLLIGNVSLQDGVRLVDLDVPVELAAQLGGGPRLGVAGIRRVIGAEHRPLLATALKPVGLDPVALAALAYDLAAGGIDIIKDDQGLANQQWAPFAERVARVTEAVAAANERFGTRAVYLPAIAAPGDAFVERVQQAVDLGADGALLMPGISGFDRLAQAGEILGPDRIIYAHPSFLGGFTSSSTHGIAPDVLFGLIHRLAGADAVIFPSYGGRFSFTEQQCRDIGTASTRAFAGVGPTLPSPGGGMAIDRVPELVDLYGRDVLLLIGADLHRGGDQRAASERFRAAAEAIG
jgi:ribulose-bisphosphate carboxylase large chain